MSVLVKILYFIIKLFFSLILFILWLRVALKFFRVRPQHGVSLVIHEFTKPLLGPLDQMLASEKRAKSRYDIAGFIGIGLVELVKFIILGFIVYGLFIPVPYLFLLIFTDFILQPCNLLFYATIIRVIISWVNPGSQHPFVDILKIVTDPILEYIGRYVPPIAGMDFSPLVLIILLTVISFIISGVLPPALQLLL